MSIQWKGYAIIFSEILKIDTQELSSGVQVCGVFVGLSLNFWRALITSIL